MDESRATNRGLKRIQVYLDVLVDGFGEPITFSALTDGRRWNGWATPYFEKHEADRLVSEFNRWSKQVGGIIKAEYDSEYDLYVFHDRTLDPPQERFGAIHLEGMKLYPVGAAEWCWSAVGDFEDG